jgi:hypothetical protein
MDTVPEIVPGSSACFDARGGGATAVTPVMPAVAEAVWVAEVSGAGGRERDRGGKWCWRLPSPRSKSSCRVAARAVTAPAERRVAVTPAARHRRRARFASANPAVEVEEIVNEAVFAASAWLLVVPGERARAEVVGGRVSRLPRAWPCQG